MQVIYFEWGFTEVLHHQPDETCTIDRSDSYRSTHILIQTHAFYYLKNSSFLCS